MKVFDIDKMLCCSARTKPSPFVHLKDNDKVSQEMMIAISLDNLKRVEYCLQRGANPKYVQNQYHIFLLLFD